MSNVITNRHGARRELRSRISEIVQDLGGVAALARRAGLSPSTIAQYISDKPGRASEPGATAALKLARGAGVRLEWLVAGEGPKRASESAPIDFALLRLVVEGVEEGLTGARRTMPPAKKADLVARCYELFADQPRKADLRKVIALVRAAA
jgi:transcriptional regulator with XRE-family HTH domain